MEHVIATGALQPVEVPVAVLPGARTEGDITGKRNVKGGPNASAQAQTAQCVNDRVARIA